MVVFSFDEPKRAESQLNLKIIASRKGDFLTQQNSVAAAIAFIQRVNCCIVPFAAKKIDASSIVEAVRSLFRQLLSFTRKTRSLTM
ncbi:hypothetical protein [Nostoc punctiforme]|jgi:hypothetical protein|uniref:Uncharacterized protein n=1 Tax=Nostoc punctiforme (strain ATCC 29133 / PCC 73102) TaxID=63737 RepID=B2IZG1_NOSP7|nr:hypothetical protein [Nostoc punctiforme]ACC84803.1 hypothetical protein Npun_R6543 [Nostoc punctiforme PCC 73102]